MRYPTLAMAPVLLGLLSACGSTEDPATVLEAVRLTEKAHHEAISARDLDGAVRVYATDAAIMALDGDKATGREAISDSYEQLLADEGLSLEVVQGPGWGASSGDLAVTTYSGTLTRTDPASGAVISVPVENKTVWARANGAPWQIASEHTILLPASAPAPLPEDS